MKRILLVTISVFYVCTVFANVRLPRIFGDQMVLQRDRAIQIWGWADKGERVTVQFLNQKKTTTTGKDGKWRIVLQPEAAGGPYTLSVKGKNAIVLNDVLVGDVWICSGQSNMEWSVLSSNNPAQEIAAANYPQIRHIKVANDVGETPKDDLMRPSTWQKATSEHVGAFTAVGYYFARELHQQLGIPVGLINTSWGGTDVETWTSREAFETSEEFRHMIRSVPVMNMDSAVKQRTFSVMNIVKEVQGGLPNSSSLMNWKEPGFDDSKMPTMPLPGLWEGDVLKDLDGVVWFRRIIDVPAAHAEKMAELHLSMIDDNDETYLNGEKIGSTKGYNIKRVYTIPAGILKAGKNVIAVRMEDTGGGGGLHGDSDDMKLVIGSAILPLSGAWAFGVESVSTGNSFLNPNSFPTLLYNAMIHPLVPFGIKGAIWYQGENNATRAHQYRQAFPLMINDWRKKWGQGNFPFYFVQLASFKAANGTSATGSTWAELREAQTMTLSLPNTGMVVTTDIGETNDIHPKNKQDVGKRLAALALRNTYQKDVVASGPVYSSMKVDGSRVIVSFDNVGTGLNARDKYGYLKGFEIAGADQKFHYAKAHIEGNNVVVYNEVVTTPVAVRFAWADDAGEANLFNKEGLPAVPFRTDTWKGITEGKKYRQ
ncbi:MAG TPA: sialate O-acetylesterase [Chitinophagaceae bacterium]|nr:sialate O-acetylesterase [Chitinophagaceae bacterium]